MWTVARVTTSASDALARCVSNFSCPISKARHLGVAPAIQQASDIYEFLAGQNQIHQFQSSSKVTHGMQQVTGDEMRTLYRDKLSKAKQPGREIYDAIKLAPRNQRCPMCGFRQVSTLDHYLPKALFCDVVFPE